MLEQLQWDWQMRAKDREGGSCVSMSGNCDELYGLESG